MLEQEAIELGNKTQRKGSREFIVNGIRFFNATSVSKEARLITKDKLKTKDLAKALGVRTPDYYKLSRGEPLTPKLPFPLVLKPIYGTGSQGVHVNINSKEEFKSIAQKLLKTKKSIMVEEYVEGKKYRVLNTDNKILSVIYIEAQTITGNGRSSIEELINRKNIERREKFKHLPPYVLPKIKISKKVLERHGYTKATALPRGLVLQIYDLASMTTGGKAYEFFDDYKDIFHNICVDSVKAVPGLKLSGTDIIVTEDGTQYLIELNSYPNLDVHLGVENREPINVFKGIMEEFLNGQTK